MNEDHRSFFFPGSLFAAAKVTYITAMIFIHITDLHYYKF